MSGIAGAIGAVAPGTVERMLGAIGHRGDATDVVATSGATLGVRAWRAGAAVRRGDGTWFVDLDGPDAPVDGHEALVVELAGTLPTARVYLEAGADERWRSPPMAVRPEWTRHRLRLATFERQRRVDGRWQAGGGGPPAGAVAVSVKLGHFVNDAGATGLVRVAGIGLE